MSLNTRDVTQGGQVAFMRWRMFLQINNILTYWLLLSFTLLTGVILYARVALQEISNGLLYWYVVAMEPMYTLAKSSPKFRFNYNGYELEFTTQQMLTDRYTTFCGQLLIDELKIASLASLVIVVVVGLAFYWWLGLTGKKQSLDEIAGGRTLETDHKKVAKLIRKQKKTSDFVIDGLPMIKNTEVQNFAMHGTVGTGKSTLIRKFLDQCRERNDLVIIYDKGCTFVQEYYDETRDKLLNPMDARCANWDMWGECSNLTALETITGTLIPQAAQSADPFWQNSARTIFAEAAETMRNDPERSYTKLLQTMLSIELKKLHEYLIGTPAANLVDSNIEKTAIAIRSVLTNYAKSFRYLQGVDSGNKPKFTIREWMLGNTDRTQNGWLFVTSNQAHHESVKPVISMWLQIAANSLLAMGPNPRRRVWFIYDELPTLHKLPTLPGIIAEARKFGGCFMLGFQSNAQLEEIYGDRFAKSMIDLLNTRFFFRSPSADIAQYVERELGQVVRKRFTEQTSFGSEQVRDGISFGKDEERVSIVSYSDIQRLEDLECFITLPGNYPVVRHKLTYTPKTTIAPDLIERPITTSLDSKIAQTEHRPARTLVQAAIAIVNSENAAETPSPTQVPAPASALLSQEKVRALFSNAPVSQSTPPAAPEDPEEQPRIRKRTFARPQGTDTTQSGQQDDDANEPDFISQQPIPPGISEDGEVLDLAVYEEDEQSQQGANSRQVMRREEARINHIQHELEP